MDSLPRAGLESALQFLQSRENYERWQTIPYDPARMGLDRMWRLLELIGSPQRGLPVVHVAGTKGKGSTSAMIAAALTSAGYRTGRYTSPHLARIEERIAIDGRPCLEEFGSLVEEVRPAVEAIDRSVLPGQSGPTFFEIMTAVALLYFARRNVDAAVLEVGLGGRLDATNICEPVVSLITSISLDHTQQLGGTLAAIAAEKAGIVRPGVPVVSGVVDPEPRDVIRQACCRNGCRLIERATDFSFDYLPPRHLEKEASPGRMIYRPGPGIAPMAVDLSLPGRHQAANAAMALAAIEVMRQSGWSIPPEPVSRALGSLRWPARVEVVSRRPAVVLDSAHNVASVETLIETLRESFQAARSWLIFATTQDKDVPGMLRALLGHFDEICFTQYADNPRAAPVRQLQQTAEELTGRCLAAYPRPDLAWQAVRKDAGEDDLICIAGSFFLAAQMEPTLRTLKTEN